ncbi:MAG: competence/damage-inducible protein A [Phycisphaerae bacterium]|nr:competence/damage-inducible protein A [Phycisphaerae bacterium]
MTISAIIISIGDELILGQTVDTNTAWLSGQLASLGIDIQEHITLADDRRAIAAHLRRAAERADVTLVTGGLGPTEDDLTRHALADVLGSALVLHEESLKQIKQFFSQIAREMVPANRVQAMIPQGCDPIENRCGTAPGMAVVLGENSTFLMPGVPREMKQMFRESVMPPLRELAEKRGRGEVLINRTLHTAGIGESTLAQIIGDMMKRGENPVVNSTAAEGVVGIRINARASDEAAARKLIEPVERELRDKLGAFIYGCDGETLAQVAGERLKRDHATLAVAESCTGGWLGKELTDMAGSSDFFKGGWITYSNEAKVKCLGVDVDVINQHGAVSEPVAGAMAEGARSMAGSDYGIGITGIAGPSGGTADKPVGLVYIALASGQGTTITRNIFPGTRDGVRRRAVNQALDMIRKRLG